MVTMRLRRMAAFVFLGCALASPILFGQEKRAAGMRKRPAAKVIRDADLPYPPKLPGNVDFVSDASPQLLQRPGSLKSDVAVAEEPPRIDFYFYPKQDYPGRPWSNWGDGSVASGKFYSAIGDHYAIGRGEPVHGTGTALVYELDPQARTLRALVDVAQLLELPNGSYTPGKIHSRVDMGNDGWLYYATHRGSPKAAVDANHYGGDWIMRTNPKTGESEVVLHAPVKKHSIPNSVLDAERMIFYGATAAGPDAAEQEIQFFAYDIHKRKILYSGSNGPARCMVLAKSSGRVYFVPGNADGELFRYDPSSREPPTATGQTIGIRAASEETADGTVYTVSNGQRSGDAALWRFNTKTEVATRIGSIAVGSESYVASIDVGPQGRYLYYVPGAHGGGFKDGSPLVQYDLKNGRKKVLAFFHPFFQKKYGFTPKGTYCSAVSADGDKVFITWNVSRGTRAWDCCGLAVVHIPSTERKP